ncbi:ras GTPase-activating protein 1 [Centrocercus urophasianus]|uniref:ras GTPase-activating protein 1 n=1 Tax=Centrocercus urophasianus TaxID=9002 RepID=UPI001C650031|nr:ras GTPase-activating protein 1 [Centrocercus urophasianus]
MNVRFCELRDTACVCSDAGQQPSSPTSTRSVAGSGSRFCLRKQSHAQFCESLANGGTPHGLGTLREHRPRKPPACPRATCRFSSLLSPTAFSTSFLQKEGRPPVARTAAPSHRISAGRAAGPLLNRIFLSHAAPTLPLLYAPYSAHAPVRMRRGRGAHAPPVPPFSLPPPPFLLPSPPHSRAHGGGESARGGGAAPLAAGGAEAAAPGPCGAAVSAQPPPSRAMDSGLLRRILNLTNQTAFYSEILGLVRAGGLVNIVHLVFRHILLCFSYRWYHGKLDRTIAEERLRQAGKPGSYLIRESDRRPGSFVLSFLSKTNVNHFRIIAMCGDYYIGGRRFASLSDLIGYYSHVSCLLKGEKLLFPVAPPEPVEDRRRVRAILPYTKVPETDEISFLKGDMFIVHNELEDGWMWVTNLRTDEQGLIVEDLVEEVGREEDPHEGKIWFHGKISKQEAYNLLMTVGQVCSFLVRPSDNTPGDYSLYFRTSENIQRFKICPTANNQFMMGGRYYNSIADIIEHYRKEQIVEGYYLKDPVPMQHQEQVFNDTLDGKEIYNTIRRKTKDAFYKNIVKKGYLLKKSKGKRWKNLYFILEGNDAQLIYFESEKRATKPKGLIDLSVCSVYGVHDSLFGRPNCFQIVVQHFSEEHYIFYFAGETPEQAQDWMKALQMFCSLRKTSPGTSNKRLRQVSSLILHVEEAHTLPIKHFTNPYCNIYLNSVQVAKTHIREGQNPVWSEEFVFDDLSSDINRFEISLSNKTKKSKDPDILFMRCQLSRLQKGHATDEWFQLSSHVPLKGIEPGSLRVRARYSMEKIMPEEEYSEFKELILQKELHVVYALSHVCGQDRTLLAGILLKIFLHEKLESLLLRTLNDREISMEDEATTLFRATTLASTLMEQYMKATATRFVHHALKDSILKIMESKQSCELNPSKLEKNEDVNTNLAHLLSILSELVEKIFMAAEILPPTLRYIYGCLQKSVQNKWPANTTMRTRVVSGFVFLRLICPAILNPRMFNIISDSPSPTAARTLTLVAKSVQNLANLVEFGAKEPYMEGVNPFIKSNKHRMIMFLDELGNVPELPDTTEHSRTDLSRDLAALHEICVAHSDELRTLSNERGVMQHVLKKLLAITELLQQKQNQYSVSNNIR